MTGAWLLVLMAHGVNDPPRGVAPLFVDGEIEAVATNYGLLIRDGDAWAWTPEEPLGVTSIVAAHAFSRTSVWLGTPQGLFVTEDGGCVWSRSSMFGEASITGLLVRGERLLVATEGGRGTHGIWRTDGETFVAVLTGTPLQIRAIAAGPSRVWASIFDPATGAELAYSDDDGATFTRVSAPFEGAVASALFADEDGAVAIAAGARGSAVYSIGFDARATRVQETDLDLVDVARVDGVIYAADEDGAVHVVDEDVHDAGFVARTFADCGVPCAALDVTQGDAHFVEVGDAEALVPFEAVRPRRCPPGSAMAEAIARQWPVLENLGIGPPLSAEAAPTGCACSDTRGHEAPWVLVCCAVLWCARIEGRARRAHRRGAERRRPR